MRESVSNAIWIDSKLKPIHILLLMIFYLHAVFIWKLGIVKLDVLLVYYRQLIIIGFLNLIVV